MHLPRPVNKHMLESCCKDNDLGRRGLVLLPSPSLDFLQSQTASHETHVLRIVKECVPPVALRRWLI